MVYLKKHWFSTKRSGKGGKNTWDKQKTNSKMTDVNPTISIIILTMNALKTSIKHTNDQSS